MRVLLADDHSIVRRGLRGLLEAADITVVAEAADGLEAIRLCEEHPPDLLILDISMPKLTAGKPFFSPAVAAVLVEDYVRQLQQRGLTDSYHLLTDREKEVLQLLAEGRSNKDVALLLELGLSTVETHRANLMQKLNLHNTAEIVLYAVRKGLIV